MYLFYCSILGLFVVDSHIMLFGCEVVSLFQLNDQLILRLCAKIQQVKAVQWVVESSVGGER